MKNSRQNKILGLITARGGSKRIPRKNIKEFLGKPLLAWSIEVGKESDVFDRFILTTDNEEISKVGKEYGIEVPFIRPEEFATDIASSYEAVKHAVEWLRDSEGYEADWVILLEPSSPGRQSFHLKEVAELIYTRDDFDSIIGITEIPGHFSHLKELKKDDGGIVTRIGDEAILRNLIHRNQDIPTSYYINSSLYAFKTSNLFDGNSSLWGGSTYGYTMDEKYSLDIDTPIEWVIAEVKMKELLK